MSHTFLSLLASAHPVHPHPCPSLQKKCRCIPYVGHRGANNTCVERWRERGMREIPRVLHCMWYVVCAVQLTGRPSGPQRRKGDCVPAALLGGGGECFPHLSPQQRWNGESESCSRAGMPNNCIRTLSLSFSFFFLFFFYPLRIFITCECNNLSFALSSSSPFIVPLFCRFFCRWKEGEQCHHSRSCP